MDGAEEIDSGIGWISDGQQCITAGQAQSGVAGQRGLYLWDPVYPGPGDTPLESITSMRSEPSGLIRNNLTLLPLIVVTYK